MTAIDPAAPIIPQSDALPKPSKKVKKGTEGGIAVRQKSVWATVIAALIAIIWTIPTLGLFITSFRPQIDVIRSGWWTVWQDPQFTLENYTEALTGGTTNLSSYFLNSFIITIPAVVIPLLTLFVDLGLAGTFWPIWIAHSIFALPLAIYLLHNFMSELPKELFEAARVDGAGHLTIFFKILLPLMLPAIAAFAIFQFLWVWNDLLVGLTFGASPEVAPLTVRIAELSGTRGSAWHLLSAGAFISMVVPLIVFISMQRYFVRGLLAGSVKG